MGNYPPHRKSLRNPGGFHLDSWNYRMLRLRRALGWSQVFISSVMGVGQDRVSELETGKVTRPTLALIRKIRNLEAAYADILKEYDKRPTILNRLVKHVNNKRHHGVKYLPIEIRRPADIKSLGEDEAEDDDLFFGKKTRRVASFTGRSPEAVRRLEKASRTIRQKAAERRNKVASNNQERSGRSSNDG